MGDSEPQEFINLMKKKNRKAHGNANANSKSASARTVADKAGVSVMTVSRALRDRPGVSEKTRKLVRKIADEIGYRPQLAARALRTGIVETVGFLIWSQDALRGQYHSESLAGMDSVVSESGYNMLLAVPPAGTGMGKYAQRLISEGRVGALVIQGARLTARELEAIPDLNAPTILINYHFPESKSPLPCSCVGFDNYEGIEQAVRHLAALGHKRIAYIGGTPEDQDAIERESAFRQVMKSLGLPLKSSWIRPGHFAESTQAGQAQADYLLAEGKNRPTAVVCASDGIAYGVLTSMRRAGGHVPEGLSVVGFDNQEASEHVVPPLTTLDHDGWQLGRRAGEELLRRINNPEEGPRRLTLTTQLIVRDSTAPPPGSK